MVSNTWPVWDYCGVMERNCIYILQNCEQKLSLIAQLYSYYHDSFVLFCFIFVTGSLYFDPDEGKFDFSYVVTCSKLMINDTENK